MSVDILGILLPAPPFTLGQFVATPEETYRGVPLIIDLQQPTLVGGIIIFPDYAFAALPKQPDDLIDYVFINGGGNCCVNINIQGEGGFTLATDDFPDDFAVVGCPPVEVGQVISMTGSQ